MEQWMRNSLDPGIGAEQISLFNLGCSDMKRWHYSLLVAPFFVLAIGCSRGASEGESAARNIDSTPAVRVPDEPLTEADLYAAAQKAEHRNQPQEAIRLYRRILSEYPQSPDNYKAAFLIGFVFSEELNQPDSARVAFNRVIQEYPNSEFVDDAEAMLKFLDGALPAFEETPSP